MKGDGAGPGWSHAAAFLVPQGRFVETLAAPGRGGSAVGGEGFLLS